VPLGASDGFVNERDAAGEPNAARMSVTLQKFTVGNAGDDDGLVCVFHREIQSKK
jgi:hypothetical protein